MKRVTQRVWKDSMTDKAERAARVFGVEDAPKLDGYEHIGWTWEYDDGSLGVVKHGESVGHRNKPEVMRPVYAPVGKK